MNKRFMGLVLFAVVISLAASAVVYRLLARRMTAGQVVPLNHAVMAARDIPVGSLLKEEDLKEVDWNGQLPSQAITKIENALGRGVTIALRGNDLVMDDHLAEKGAGVGLAVRIPNGMRAVAVKVNEVVGLAGFVLPGMRVDVIACGTPPGKSKDTLGIQSRTLLQNIEVLSAGQNIQRDSDGKPVTVQVVNLLVTPAQAEVMSLAGNETKVQLVLRNPGDSETKPTPGTATAFLFNAQPVRPVYVAVRQSAPAPAPKTVEMEKVIVPVTMEVISGAKRETTRVGQTIEERVKEDKRK